MAIFGLKNTLYKYTGEIRGTIMGLGQILFKVTGFMTKRVRLNKCAELGEFLTKRTIESGQKTSLEDVSLFLKQTLSPRKMKHITVAGDKKVLKEFMIKEMGISAQEAEIFSEKFAASSTSTNPITGNSLLDLRIADMNTAQAVNTCVHETQHLFKRTSAIDTKLCELYSKIRGVKWTENLRQEYSEISSRKYREIQEILAGHVLHYSNATEGFAGGEALEIILQKTGCKNIKQLREYLRKMIRKDILIPECNEKNYRVLKHIRQTLQDEANSYKAGGLAEKYFNNKAGIAYNGDTKAETVSRLYEETNKVLRGEIRRQRINNIKRFFGLKPKEHAVLPNITGSAEEIVNPEEIMTKVKQGKITEQQAFLLLND